MQTNLVRATVGASGRKAAQWSADLKQRGVLVSACSTWDLRFVTHRHIGDAEIDHAVSVFADAWKKQVNL